MRASSSSSSPSSSSSSSPFAIFKLLPRSRFHPSRLCIHTLIPSASSFSPLIPRISFIASFPASSPSWSSSLPPSASSSSSFCSSSSSFCPRSAISGAVVSAAAVSAAQLESDPFFAAEGVTWKSLGLAPDVIEALQRASFMRPSAVQVPPVWTLRHTFDIQNGIRAYIHTHTRVITTTYRRRFTHTYVHTYKRDAYMRTYMHVELDTYILRNGIHIHTVLHPCIHIEWASYIHTYTPICDQLHSAVGAP
jgi:hypothetical protein